MEESLEIMLSDPIIWIIITLKTLLKIIVLEHINNSVILINHNNSMLLIDIFKNNFNPHRFWRGIHFYGDLNLRTNH